MERVKNPVTVKIRHCRNCPHRCDWPADSRVVGCISCYFESPAVLECFKRVWFDKEYRIVDYWRLPTLKEGLALLDGRLSQSRFEEIKRQEFEELKKLQEVKKVEHDA